MVSLQEWVGEEGRWEIVFQRFLTSSLAHPLQQTYYPFKITCDGFLHPKKFYKALSCISELVSAQLHENFFKVYNFSAILKAFRRIFKGYECVNGIFASLPTKISRLATMTDFTRCVFFWMITWESWPLLEFCFKIFTKNGTTNAIWMR